MAITDTFAAIVARVYQINESLEIPVSVQLEYEHGKPKYIAGTLTGRREFASLEELQEFIAGIEAEPEILYFAFGHGTMRYVVRTAMDPHNAIEYTDAEALLAWLDACVDSPEALSEGLRYQKMEILRRRQQEDAEELARLEADGDDVTSGNKS